MTTLRETRDILPLAYANDDLSDDEYLLLYDLNTSKNPDFTKMTYTD